MVTTQFKAGNETARRHIFNAGNRPICGGGMAQNQLWRGRSTWAKRTASAAWQF